MISYNNRLYLLYFSQNENKSDDMRIQPIIEKKKNRYIGKTNSRYKEQKLIYNPPPIPSCTHSTICNHFPRQEQKERKKNNKKEQKLKIYKWINENEKAIYEKKIV